MGFWATFRPDLQDHANTFRIVAKRIFGNSPDLQIRQGAHMPSFPAFFHPFWTLYQQQPIHVGPVWFDPTTELLDAANGAADDAGKSKVVQQIFAPGLSLIHI